MRRSLALVPAGLVVAPVLASLAAATPARADEVDPRWRYSAELAPGIVLMDESTTGSSAPGKVGSSSGGGWLLRGAFMAPIGENRLAGGGLMGDGRGHAVLFGEYRLQQDLDDPRITTRLGAGPVMDVWPAFALGVRGVAGAAFEFMPGWRGGLDAGVTLTAIHFRAAVELAFSIAYLF